MKIVLAAIEKEQTSELALMSLGSYAHLCCRKSAAAAIFFPLEALPEVSMSSAICSLAKKVNALIGVGFAGPSPCYGLFFPDGTSSLLKEGRKNMQIEGKPFELCVGIGPSKDISCPSIFLRRDAVDLQKQAREFPSKKEIYFLGQCRDGVYQAAVFESGKVKCRLPEDHPNLLAKSVPSSSWGE